MEVWATVVLPASVTLEVPDDTPVGEIRQMVLNQADQIWEGSGIDAVIQDSNIPELID